jgi:hypothetical protein
MSECWSVSVAFCKFKKQENGAIWFAQYKEFEMIYTSTFDT